jgi:recombination associated protein RdgC
MGLLKGTFTFSRFRVTEDIPEDFASYFNRQIRKFAFQDFSTLSEELSMGWTSIGNNLDTRFEYANYALADYMIFSLRIDRKAVPAGLLRIKAAEAQKAFLAERKQERLYKEQRKQIVEAVRLDLLGKALPSPAFHDTCWCPSKKWLIFGSHAEKVNEDFAKLFERTFKLKLHPFTPWDTDRLDSALAETIARDEADSTKLGRDFLTWLWFKSEERNGTISLEGDRKSVV